MAYFGAIQVTAMIVLAVVLALFLDSPYCLRRKVFALIYFLPYAVPGVIAAVMWGFLLQPDLDNALKVPHFLGLASGPLNPLSYGFVLYAMMIIVTWEWTGYNMTILLTSLTSVPPEVLESSRIDGASELKIAWRIKLPMIRRTIAFIGIISVIGTLQLFNEPVILNDIASIGGSYSPNQIIYNTAFSFGNEQLAAAQSIVLALITVIWRPRPSTGSCGIASAWPALSAEQRDDRRQAPSSALRTPAARRRWRRTGKPGGRDRRGAPRPLRERRWRPSRPCTCWFRSTGSS